ncbi:MAG: hypothetical protein Kow0042_31810 [Calditrichia bacterium]
MLISEINNYLQRRMQLENLEEVPVTVAATWLHNNKMLKDSSSSPGYPLRRHIHNGNIFGAYKKNNYYWFIRRIPNYNLLLSAKDLSIIFGLKCRTSLYRKIRRNLIPFGRKGKRGIYFQVSDLLKWAVEKNQPEVVEKIQNYFTQKI